MMQRLRLNASRKEGFSSTVSERALISLLPIPGSFAHRGTSPPLKERGLACLTFLTNPQDHLGRGDVIPLGERRHLLDFELLSNLLRRRSLREPTAHGAPPARK